MRPCARVPAGVEAQLVAMDAAEASAKAEGLAVPRIVHIFLRYEQLEGTVTSVAPTYGTITLIPTSNANNAV